LNKERRPYRTKDGYICIIVYTDKHWQNFLRLIGRPTLMAEDERFNDIGSRTEHAHAIYTLIGDAMTERTTAEWLDLLIQADIPAAPLHTLYSMLEDPHLLATNFFQVVEHPTEGPIRQMAIPSKWTESKPSIRRHAPLLGEHSVEVLREAGITGQHIESMLANGVTLTAE